MGKPSPSVTAALLVSITLVACATSPAPQELKDAVQHVLSGQPVPPVSPTVWTDVRRFYTQTAGEPVWVNHRGAMRRATRAIDVLLTASQHGLRAEDYGVDALRHSAETIRKMYAFAPTRTRQIGELEVDLTAALLAYGHDVALGRAELAPTPGWRPRRTPPDFVGTLVDASRRDLTKWIETIRPRHPEYVALQQALGDLRVEREKDGDPAEIDARIQLVALNLNRWRWLPDDLGERHFLINIPRFELVAHESGKDVLSIRVVVGRLGDNTPIFSDDMESVVFSPYWNIPESIAQSETAPAVARDNDYLTRQNIEVLRASARGLERIEATDVDWEDPVALRKLVLRQQPGPKNALGFVKFLFPNPYNVYLHDTPADRLFSRDRRAFSHGCIRVEEPEVLARYVLRDQAEWTATRISSAMGSGAEKYVKLTRKIPVHIVYFTAWVDARGALHFEPDIYGYDRAALQ